MISLDRLWLIVMYIRHRLFESKIHCPQRVESWWYQIPWTFIHFIWVYKFQLDFKTFPWIRTWVVLVFFLLLFWPLCCPGITVSQDAELERLMHFRYKFQDSVLSSPIMWGCIKISNPFFVLNLYKKHKAQKLQTIVFNFSCIWICSFWRCLEKEKNGIWHICEVVIFPPSSVSTAQSQTVSGSITSWKCFFCMFS